MNSQITIDINNNAYCISNSEKKYSALCEWFDSRGLAAPHYFQAAMHPDKSIGVALSHIMVLVEAKRLNLPYIIVYEDDAYPCIDVIGKFNEYTAFLDKHNENWYALQLGYSGKIKNAVLTEACDHIFNVNYGMCGSHAVIFREKSYDLFIKSIFIFAEKHRYVAPDACFGDDCFSNKSYVLDDCLFMQKDIIKKQYWIPEGYENGMRFGQSSCRDMEYKLKGFDY